MGISEMTYKRSAELVDALRTKNLEEYYSYHPEAKKTREGMAMAMHYALLRAEAVLEALLQGEPIGKHFEGLQ